ncbi:Flagellar cap protein [Mycobacteroides abscessus subsp. abscessus]|nr:Flagellar cap protein [Mycobacteroides abscessus subsp. abscessus]
MSMRIGGLASGMDIDTMVSDLMKAERIPLDKLKQKKQILEWQRDDYRSMNTLLLNFRTELTNMKLSSTYRSRATTTSDESKVTATATSAASLASYSITKVDQLATVASKVSNGKISDGLSKKIDTTQSLESQLGGTFTWTNGSAKTKTISASVEGTSFSLSLDSGVSVDTSAPMNVKVNGVSYEILSSSTSFDTSKKQVKIDTDGNLTFSQTIAKDSSIKVDYVTTSTTEKYTSFSITTTDAEGKKTLENFNISSTDSLNSVINKVNSSNVGVSMFYDTFTDKMTLTRKETGDFNKTPDGETPDELNSHEIITDGDFIDNLLKFGTASESGGENAKFMINGLETERTSNTFDISGVTFTLKKTFSDSPATISLSNNTTQVFDNIKSFVTKYNELIAKIQTEVQEERYNDYAPLTDDERETLSDKQQEQWEEKAMSGMLRRDPTLTSLLTKMRSDFGNPVSSESINPLYKQLASIGIKTTSNYLEGGKLEIDEASLKKAIEADPESVEKLFNATGTTDGQKGIAQRLTDTVNATMEKLRLKAGNSFSTNTQYEIGKLLNNVGTNIDRFEDRLVQIEDRYWARFTAMEKAIQKSNDQMNQLLSYMG